MAKQPPFGAVRLLRVIVRMLWGGKDVFLFHRRAETLRLLRCFSDECHEWEARLNDAGLNHLSAIYDGAAIWMKHLPRDIRGVLRGKKNITGRNLVRLPWPFHRDVFSELAHLLWWKSGRYQRRPYRAGSHGVNAYSLLDQL